MAASPTAGARQRAWSLADLAERSGVSRPHQQDRARRGQPYRVALVRLASAFDLRGGGLMLRAKARAAPYVAGRRTAGLARIPKTLYAPEVFNAR